MTISIEQSEGKRFIRYTSDDSKDALLAFIAENGISADQSTAFVSSTSTVEGRTIEQMQLPIESIHLVRSVTETLPTSDLRTVPLSSIGGGMVLGLSGTLSIENSQPTSVTEAATALSGFSARGQAEQRELVGRRARDL